MQKKIGCVFLVKNGDLMLSHCRRGDMVLKEALLYKKSDGKKVSCFLCNHRCKIPDGGFGICGVRENRAGILYTHAYGELIAHNIDPIEKKPLYHFHPGTYSYSIAAIGCNFRCDFCQNWQISQVREARDLGLKPRAARVEDVVSQARQTGCRSISYTYTEPTIFFEFAYEISQSAGKEGLKNVFVTNGYMTAEMLSLYNGFLHAANVDLKSFRDGYYKKICKGRLAPVLDSIRLMKKTGIWIEVTTLIVPGLNDSEEEIKDIAEFLSGVDRGIPWHVSRFHPQYRMEERNATPVGVLERAYEIGREAGLQFVYLGNVPGKGNDTKCPHCGMLLVQRSGFSVLKNVIRDGKCPRCATEIAGVGL
ncbi:MAG TPA: AmmeMemoRadiSam system radical SAM enzyme [Syntrophales bacterium]|nr:AmmeMemoRadiSam system radical SAM enzyme [Syntrophales bacterium]